jgi:hypothetical protein
MTFFIALPLVMRSVNQTLWVKSSTISTGDRCQTTNFGRMLKYLMKNYMISKRFTL